MKIQLKNKIIPLIIISSFLTVIFTQAIPAGAADADKEALMQKYTRVRVSRGRTYNDWYHSMPNWLPKPVKQTTARLIFICDQAINTVPSLVALAGNFLAKSPILLWGPGTETVEIFIDFFNSLISNNNEVKVMETEPNTIPDEFIEQFEGQSKIEIVREEPLDEFVYNYCLEEKNYPKILVVADQDEFMPYAGLYASHSEGIFVNTIEEAEKIAQSDEDVKKIVYFGNNLDLAGELKNIIPQPEPAGPSFFGARRVYAGFGKQWYISASHETFAQVSSIEEAESSLAKAIWPPSRFDSTNRSNRAVTVISADDSQYRSIAPIYAYLRDTALISVPTKGKTVEEIDLAIDAHLDENILSYNNNDDPDYLVICEPWDVIPYRSGREDYMGYKGKKYFIAADSIYADRDGDLVQDMAVGRFTAYTKPSAVMLMNRGYLFSQGETERADKALILQPWKRNFSMWIGDEFFESDFYSRLEVNPVQNDFLSMYGRENVYGKIGYQTEEYQSGDENWAGPSESWPDLGTVIGLLRKSEMNYIAGHAVPYAMEATNPYFYGETVRENGPYPPSLWYLWGCGTGVSHRDYLAENPDIEGLVEKEDTLLHALITQGAVNAVVTVGNVPYGNYADWPEWATKYLAQGDSIGEAIKKGQNQAARNVEKVSAYKWLDEEGMNPTYKQGYLIGDPMVKYKSGQKASPKSFFVPNNLDCPESAPGPLYNSADFGKKIKIEKGVLEEESEKIFAKTFKATVSAAKKIPAIPKNTPAARVSMNTVPRVKTFRAPISGFSRSTRTSAFSGRRTRFR